MILNNGERPGVLKTDKEKLADAYNKVAEMEHQAAAGGKAIDQLKWMNAQLRVAITALGEHYELTAEAMQAIVQPYIDKREAEFVKMAQETKEKFMQDLKDGKVPKFETVPNPDLPKQEG